MGHKKIGTQKSTYLDKFSVVRYLSPSHRIVSPVVAISSSVVVLIGVIETLEEDEDTRNDTSNIQERV